MVIDLSILYWWDVLKIWWWLRSTTGSYGRLELEAAYGETVISLHRDCLGDVSSKRVVEVLTWFITHGRHTWATPVWIQYMYFRLFNIKSICIIFWKSIYIMKKTLVVPDVVLTRRYSRNDFDCPRYFLWKNRSSEIYHCFILKWNWFIYLFYILLAWFNLMMLWIY